MRKNFFISGIIIISFSFFLSGCGSSVKSRYKQNKRKKAEPCDCPEFKKNKRRSSFYFNDSNWESMKFFTS